MIILPSKLIGSSNLPPAGSGGGGYHASAVHFDGTAWIKHAGSLTGVSDNPYGLMSVWIKATDWFNEANGRDGLIFLGPNFDVTCQSVGGVVLNGANFVFYNLANTRHATFSMNSGWTSGAWVNVLASWDMNQIAGSKILQVYLSDVVFTDFTKDDASIAFNPDYAAADWQAGGATDNDPTGPGPIGDQADFYLNLGLSSLYDLTVVANRRKFISASGKPVSLGADGSTPTGTAPAIFFSGNASAYPTNLGTGGAFTLTGSLTNASTSPSD